MRAAPTSSLVGVQLLALCTVVLLALPWLNPLGFGPSPWVVQTLLTLLCASTAAVGLMALPPALRVRVCIAAWVLAAALSSLMGLLQYAGMSDAWYPWVSVTRAGEAFANLRQRNQFATLTAIGLAALVWGGTAWSEWGRAGMVGRGLLVALLAFGNAASASRTGLVEMLLIATLALGWRRRSGNEGSTDALRLGGLALLCYAAAALVLPALAGLDAHGSGILGRWQDHSPACASRLTLWSNVLHLIGQKPWTGWGWGELDYAHFITLYPGARFCDILDNAHNLPLHLAVELGVPVALAACGLGLWLVLRARPWAEADPVRQLAWAVLAVLGLHSLLEYPLWYGPFQLAAVLSIGMLLQSRWTFGPAASTISGIGATVCIAVGGWAAWDYHRISQIYIAPAQRAAAYRDNTLQKIRASWLFASQVRFAELGITPLTPDNAAYQLDLSRDMLHFSPEQRVAQRVVDSAALLGLKEEAAFYRQRLQAAFGGAEADPTATQ